MKSDKIQCLGCGKWHFRAQEWQHRSCKPAVVVHVEAVASNTPEAPASNRKQRWDREKYNAHMRAYMAERRKKLREGVIRGEG